MVFVCLRSCVRGMDWRNVLVAPETRCSKRKWTASIERTTFVAAREITVLVGTPLVSPALRFVSHVNETCLKSSQAGTLFEESTPRSSRTNDVDTYTEPLTSPTKHFPVTVFVEVNASRLPVDINPQIVVSYFSDSPVPFVVALPIVVV